MMSVRTLLLSERIKTISSTKTNAKKQTWRRPRAGGKGVQDGQGVPKPWARTVRMRGVKPDYRDSGTRDSGKNAMGLQIYMEVLPLIRPLHTNIVAKRILGPRHTRKAPLIHTSAEETFVVGRGGSALLHPVNGMLRAWKLR